jgi:nucleoside-diphosphate-sugar epimerase
MDRQRRVVVTGAAGFLGSHLVSRARAAGSAVLEVVRETPPGDVSATGARVAIGRLLAEPRVLDGTDVLVHAAAIRHRHGADPAAYRASNVDLTEALLRAAAGRVRRFVHVSSVGVYGFPPPERLPIDERAPFAPRTLYSQTKIDAEKLVRRLAPELGVPFTIVRPTIIYGPGDTNGMLDKLAAMIRRGTYRVIGAGQNVLHHTYVDDVCGAVEALAVSEEAAGEDFIVAGPETVTLARLGELVASALGRRIPRVHVPISVARAIATGVDVAAYRGAAFTSREPPINNEKLDVMTLSVAFDASKARAAGFTPRVGYEEGIARTLRA